MAHGRQRYPCKACGRSFAATPARGKPPATKALEEQLFTGEDLTFPIEQDDGDVRRHLARFRRRSKVTSRARHVVDGALTLLRHLRRPENFLPLRDSFLSIFG